MEPTMDVRRRVNALERLSRPVPTRCPVCGGPLGRARLAEPTDYEVHVLKPDEPLPEGDEHCPRCGRRRVFHINFDTRPARPLTPRRAKQKRPATKRGAR